MKNKTIGNAIFEVKKQYYISFILLSGDDRKPVKRNDLSPPGWHFFLQGLAVFRWAH